MNTASLENITGDAGATSEGIFSDVNPSGDRRKSTASSTKGERSNQKNKVTDDYKEKEDYIGNTLKRSADNERPGKVMTRRAKKKVAERVLNVYARENGDLVYLIKFKDIENAELVPASRGRLEFPRLVAQFYERRAFMYDKENSL